MTWVFRHTGGVPLLNLVVMCHSMEEGSGNGITNDISCGSSELVCGNGMTLLPTGSGSVTAGLNFSRTVTATIEFGSTEQHTNSVVAASGETENRDNCKYSLVTMNEHKTLEILSVVLSFIQTQ